MTGSTRSTSHGIRVPRALAVDIGGTVKALVLDDRGVLRMEPTRFPTPHPCRPETLVQLIARAAASLSEFERVSVGFPGVVREGRHPTWMMIGGQDIHLPLSWRRDWKSQ